MSDLGVRCAASDLEEEPDLLTLMLGSSRCLVTGERSTLESPAACGVDPRRKAAATSKRGREHLVNPVVSDLSGWHAGSSKMAD